MNNTNIMGVIGGLGPQASAQLYQLVIDKALHQYHARHNQDFPHLLISNLPVPDTISSEDNKEQMLDMLVSELQRLQRASCRKIYIACNTVHAFEQSFYDAVGDDFVSLIDLVVARAIQDKAKKLAVIASPTTIKTGLYRTRLEQNNIVVTNADDGDAGIYEALIRDHIAGKTDVAAIARLTGICQKFLDQGCDKIVLGCTELPSILQGQAILQHCISPLDVLADEICRNTMLYDQNSHDQNSGEQKRQKAA